MLDWDLWFPVMCAVGAAVSVLLCADLKIKWCLHSHDVTEENAQRNRFQLLCKSVLVQFHVCSLHYKNPFFFHLDLTLSLTKLISVNVCFSACRSMRETTCSWIATCLLFCTWMVRIVNFLHTQAVWPHAQNGASILFVVVLPAWELLWLVRRNLFIQDQMEMVNYHKTHLHTQT